MKFQIFTNIELEVKGTPRNVYTIMLPCMDNFFFCFICANSRTVTSCDLYTRFYMSDVYSDGSSAKSLSSLPWLRFLHFRLIHYLSCFFHCLSDSFGCANQVMLFKFQQVWQNISTSLPKKKISLWIIKFCLFRKGR